MKPCLAFLLLFHTACLPGGADQPDAAPNDELSGMPTIGVRDQIGFSLVGTSLDRPIAQGGTTYVYALTRRAARQPASVASADPSIFTASPATTLDQRSFQVRIVSAAAGDADLVIQDSGGAEIDRVKLHVRPSDELAFPSPWGGGSVSMLAGSVERWNVTTKTAGVVTAGVGAVRFQVAGALAGAYPGDALYWDPGGDTVFFRASSPGAGTVTATAPGATTQLGVLVVDPASLTTVTASPPALRFASAAGQPVTIQAFASGTQVYGALCNWTNPSELQIIITRNTGSLKQQSGIVYDVHGSGHGVYSATCTIGGRSATISVQVD